MASTMIRVETEVLEELKQFKEKHPYLKTHSQVIQYLLTQQKEEAK